MTVDHKRRNLIYVIGSSLLAGCFHNPSDDEDNKNETPGHIVVLTNRNSKNHSVRVSISRDKELIQEFNDTINPGFRKKIFETHNTGRYEVTIVDDGATEKHTFNLTSEELSDCNQSGLEIAISENREIEFNFLKTQIGCPG